MCTQESAVGDRSGKLTEEGYTVVQNRCLSGALYLIELEAPRISQTIEPGQFVHMSIPGAPQMVLRRPFSVFDSDGSGTLSILYQVVGSGTEVLSEVRAGDAGSLIGPVGSSWRPPEEGRCLLVGGGVGSAPLHLLAKRIAASKSQLQVVLGAQTKDMLVTHDAYARLQGVELVEATDDGSYGFAGFCTVPAIEVIESGVVDYVACCGPEPLMRIVARSAIEHGVRCEVSLERRMACGVGACLSCVVDTTGGKMRCCVDGPVFDASKVVW